LTSWEALRPSEPRHSPDMATPSYYTKNESFASGISKCGVCQIFTSMEVFIGPWRSSNDLAEVVTHHVVAGRPSHMASRPMTSVSTDFLHCLGLPLHV
jgi:hypothetical protein